MMHSPELNALQAEATLKLVRLYACFRTAIANEEWYGAHKYGLRVVAICRDLGIDPFDIAIDIFAEIRLADRKLNEVAA